MNLGTAAGSTPRFRGPAAGAATQQLFGALVVGALVACGVVGLLTGTALAFFAVGAGSGYSLSGSV